ncbi:MAG: biotin carboxylase N-terminal domain-containing protein [Desulfurispora sp.]|uniref:biotin carboxylase N-terminal domain-containing protein n=1 Tax=Desulfurispora sp. TaxID=3014275 RepID=UPI00404A774A
MIDKILVANRGEIAARILRACREMGIKTVCVYSEADQNAPYLTEADETYCIGPANPMKSYLNIEELIRVLQKSGARAVHPGYGFLSENAAFASAVEMAGAIWIGSPPAVLQAIESKSYCRKLAYEAGVPVIPGTINVINQLEDIYDYARNHGYPFLLKLDRGGGGKGIELVNGPEKVPEVYQRIERIGKFAFNSPTCYIEKELLRPRHIEVQFLADHYNNVVCLGERECSIQSVDCQQN